MSGMGHIPGMNHGAKPVRSSSNLAGEDSCACNLKREHPTLPESPPTPPSLSRWWFNGGYVPRRFNGRFVPRWFYERKVTRRVNWGNVPRPARLEVWSHGGSMGGLSHLAGMLGAMSHGDSAGGMSHGSSGMSGHGMPSSCQANDAIKMRLMCISDMHDSELGSVGSTEDGFHPYVVKATSCILWKMVSDISIVIFFLNLFQMA